MVSESVQLAKSVRVDYDVKLSSSSKKRESFNVSDTVELAESERIGEVVLKSPTTLDDVSQRLYGASGRNGTC